MRLFFVIPRARIAAVAAAMLAMSVSAFGQSGQPAYSPSDKSLLASAQVAAAQVAGEPSVGPVRRLSMDEAVKLALEQNLGIRIQRMDPQVQDLSVATARASWAPTLTTAFNRNSQTLQPTSAFSGSGSNILNSTFSNQVGVQQILPWGGSYTANFNSARLATTNVSTNFQPQLNSNLQVQYSQPLVRNFSIDQIRQQVLSSQKVRDLSDIQLAGVITGTVRNVRNAYWDLAYTIANLKAQQQSLALSQQSLKDNQKRVEIGTMAPIDIVQAQAEVASNEQGVIIADANIKTAQDNLRALILDPGTPDFWNISFDPTDAPSFEAQPIDVDAAVRHALETRSDLKSAKNNIEQSDINIRYFRNQILPDVNANVSYISRATGGVQLSPVTNLSDIISGNATRTIIANNGYGTVLGDVLGNTYPDWTLGVQIGYPLGTSTPKANLARARLQYEQSQTQLKNLEVQVATQVRAVARNVQTNQQRVRSARASRELQEKKLEAEEKKLAAGMSQSFFVFQAQRDLSIARTVELQAISDYNKSLVDFEAVQQVPLGGGGGGVTIAGR
jgi:outer membrane protein